MKKTILLLLSTVILTACVTEKQRRRICNTCPISTFTRDSIREIIKHDTVQVPGLPGPVRFLDNPCKTLCDSLGRLKQVDITDTKNGISVHYKTVGNSLAITAETKDTNTVVPVKHTEIFHSEKEAQVKYVECSKEHRTWFDHLTFWWFVITAGFGILFLGFKFLKGRIPFLK